MKRFICALLCLVMLFTMFLSGCRSQQPEDSIAATEAATEAPTEAALTEPEETIAVIETDEEMIIADGSILFGTDISGMTADEAYAAVSAALSQYALRLTVNGRTATLYAADMALGCSEEEVAAYLDALESGTTPTEVPSVVYDTEMLRSAIAAKVNMGATNASVVYSSSLDKFQISTESSGYRVDVGSIMELVKSAVDSLAAAVKVTAPTEEVLPTVTADDPALQNAVSAANSLLTVSLTYTYAPEETVIGTETIPVDTIGSFVSFDENNNPYLNSSKINSYATMAAENYGGESTTGNFKTTGGSYIGLNVSYYGAAVDVNAFAADIQSCLENKISGTRSVPYLDEEIIKDMPYGGNYVEINLSSQYIWLYKSGSCVVSGPIVSGCVFEKCRTPTGVYSIRKKSRNTYLVGEDYSSFVRYWMPFNGAIGLHDASWRSSFGGDIYLYDGSHGCINLPTSVASTIYENVSTGTKVILYGGASNADPITQEITGTTAYTLQTNSPAFMLDAAPLYGTYDMTYVSSNTSVVEVAGDGTVIVKGAGTATITVSLPAQKYYTEAQLVITVTVEDPCGNNHTFGEWSQTTAPTCAAGEEARTCSVCGKCETRAVDPILEHTFSDWTTTTAPTCVPGEASRSCSVCGLVETETLDPIHEHSFSAWTTTKEPTCVSGEESRSCSDCGTTETRTVDPVREHSYGEWTVTKEPTCAAAGEQSCSCTACGHTKTETISKKDHNFSSGGQYCENGCGAVNPSYQVPGEEE